MPAGWGHWVVSTKRIAARIVEEMRPGDVAAICARARGARRTSPPTARGCSGSSRPSAPATRQLDPREAGSDRQFLTAPLKLMSDMADFLAALPDRRKLMFYVGVGVPIDYENHCPAAGAVGREHGRAGRAGCARAGAGGAAGADRSRAAEQRLHLHLRPERRRRHRAGRVQCHSRREKPARPPPARRGTVSNKSHNFLQAVAENTGGRAVIRDQRAARRCRGGLRREPVVLPARLHGRRAGRPPQERARSACACASRGWSCVIDGTRSLTTGPRRQRRHRRRHSTPSWRRRICRCRSGRRRTGTRRARNRRSRSSSACGRRAPASGTVTESTEVTIVAFDDRAKPHGGHTVKADLSVQPTPVGWIPYEIVSELNLKPGTYRIRAAADNPRVGKTGSVFTDVDVPDFAKARLTMSGLALVSTPRWAAFPKEPSRRRFCRWRRAPGATSRART